MSFRIGKCTSCDASYKLPATFEADRAKCKQCGGVVEIGPAQEEAPKPPPVPAAKPAEAPAKKKRSGPSMKEQLMAKRKAEAEAAAASSPPAAKPAAKAPAAKPAAKKPAAAKPAAKAAAAAPAGASGSRRSRPAGSRSRGGRRGSEDDGEEGGSKRRGRRTPEKKGLPVGGLIGIVVLVIAAVGAAVFLSGGEDPAPAQTGEEVASGDSEAAEDTAEDNGTADEAGTTEASASTEETDGDSSEDAGDEAASSDEEAAPAEEKPAKKPASNLTDPDSIDLSLIPDFGAITGCSPDRFAELEGLVATMVDPMAGAAGNRAKRKLVDAGKESFPPILNALKTLDLTDEDQFRSADVCQKALQDICNGNNFGWKYPSQEPDKFHAYDKKAIRAWSQAWEKAENDDAYWAKLAKLDKVPETPSEDDAIDAELDALDGLDDF